MKNVYKIFEYNFEYRQPLEVSVARSAELIRHGHEPIESKKYPKHVDDMTVEEINTVILEACKAWIRLIKTGHYPHTTEMACWGWTIYGK